MNLKLKKRPGASAVKFFLTAIMAVMAISILCADARARQPIIEKKGGQPYESNNYETYENEEYDFSIRYHKSLKKSSAHGGIVSFIPHDSLNYRFVPALTVSCFYVLKNQDISELLNMSEKNFSAMPFYRLVSVNKLSRDSLVAAREFVDNNLKETVYEVALYRKNGNTLYETAWQVPKAFAASDTAVKFERCLDSFRVMSADIPAENAQAISISKTSEVFLSVNSFIQNGNFLKALAELKTLRAHYPGNPEIYILTGKCYLGLKEYSKASENYKTLAYSFPANLELRNMYIDSLIMQKDFKKALAECKKSLELKGSARDMAACYLNLGNIFLSVKKYEEARNSYIEGISKFPNNPQLHNNAAIVSMKMNDAETAREYFKTAITLDPAYKIAHLGLARLYLGENDQDMAAVHYLEILKIDKNHKESYVGLLNIYKKKGIKDRYDELVLKLKNGNMKLYEEVMVEVR